MLRHLLLAPVLIASVALVSLAQWTHADDPSDDGEAQKLSAQDVEFFEKKIRPVLIEKCYSCHSAKAEKVRGGFLLDTRAGLLAGGDNGPAVVPGDVDSSPIIQAIRYTKKEYAMPPEKAGGKLADAVIHDFEEWVKRGAPDPRAGKSNKAVKKDIAQEARKWWAYQPLQQPAVPTVPGSWATTGIDRFIQATRESKGLQPVSDADPATLLRRVTFDLTGLPPTTAAQQKFLADWKQNSNLQAVYAQVVDELLASPRFGEQWGRHWLDVARFGESCGKDVNVTYPHAWRYRDYVIQSLNSDKPYDRFLQEQLAGDLLPAQDDKQRAEHLIATGYLALGARSINEQNPTQFVVDQVDEMIDTVSQSLMGITVACARCHDHKFDPIPQKDYTAWAGIFLSTDVKYGTSGGVASRNAGTLIELPADAEVPIVAKGMTSEERKKKEGELTKLKEELRTAISERSSAKNEQAGFSVVRIATQLAKIQIDLNSTHVDGSPKPLAMGVGEKPVAAAGAGRLFPGKMAPGKGAPGKDGMGPGRRPLPFNTIGDSPLFARGEVNKPTERVPRGTLTFFSNTPLKINKNESGRKQLAQWIIEQPLTSRVMVNRTWHWLFGRGLVASVDNFGLSGETPSHPELLDYLAQQFKANGWSMKKLIRSIVLSHTYQLASTSSSTWMETDPDNKYLWRHTPRRLEAESIRDAMLSASGVLDLKPPPASLIGRAGDGPIGGPRISALTEGQLLNTEGNYRSIYLPAARNVAPIMLATFDHPDGSIVQGARETTNVPSQALFLLNSDFVKHQAEKLAASLLSKYPGTGLDKFNDRFTLATQLTYGRAPTKAESDLARNYLVKSKANTGTASAKIAWTSLCRTLFASAEFRMLE